MTPSRGCVRAAVVAALLLIGTATRAQSPAPPASTPPAPPVAADDAGCPTGQEVDPADEPLPAVGRAIGAGALRVLAVGSASTAEGGTRADPSYAARAVDRLRAALPNVTITLTSRGAAGLEAAKMVSILREELPRLHPDLVIWQTGTVEAVRGVRTDEFAQELAEGARLIAAAGADLVLVDPQYSRFLRANADVDAYRGALRAAAAMPGVVIFDRYELMRGWAGDGAIDLERTAEAERRRMVATLHECLGRALAAFLLAGASPIAQP